MQKTDFDIGNIIDRQPVRRITVVLLGLCFLAMLSDGYNLGAASLAAPGIVKYFGIHRSAVAPIFSAALLGMLVGALASGFLGDRFGRKRGIVLTTAIICLGSLGCAVSQGINALLMLRFLTGVGLGGLLPNVTALMSEFVPKRVRATFTAYAFMGITVGGALPGIFSSLLLNGNWRGLFLAGGLIPLAILPLLALMLPESLKFLVLRPGREAELRLWLYRLAPDIEVPVTARFVLNEPRQRFALASLFDGNLRVITPVLWVAYINIMLVNFFVNSWLALVLTDIGLSQRQAAGTASLYYVGGICGVLVIGRALDVVGPVMLAIYALLGCVITALIALPGSPASLTYLLVALVGLSILGAQVGMSAITGLLYPTAIRSKGAGFAHSIGRLGAIAGPLLGGVLISKQSSFLTLFLVPVIPLSIAAISFLAITWAWTGHLRGRGLAQIRQLQHK